jgi:hypothetical protein
MLRILCTGLLSACTISIAVAQSTSPLSNDNRGHITAQTHCKDKTGQIWLKSSAILAGTTPQPHQSPPSSDSTPGTGVPDVSALAATLPDCPNQSAAETDFRQLKPASPETTGASDSGSASNSAGSASTRTPSGLTPD